MSDGENIFLNGVILGMTNKEIESRFNDIVDFTGLETFIDTPVKNFSSGMVVRLWFAIAANVEQEILLINEVLAIGDAAFQQRCYEKIETFRQDGRTLVLASHGLSQVKQIFDQAAWIDRGKLKALPPTLEAVRKYSGTFHNALPPEEGSIGDRWGLGEVLITKFETLSGRASREILKTHSNVTIRIHCDAPPPIKDAVIGVCITYIHGTNVSGDEHSKKACKFFAYLEQVM